MRNIVFMLGLMSCASLQAQGISSNNRIDLSGQWRFSQGDAPTYEDVVKLPGSMLTNGKGSGMAMIIGLSNSRGNTEEGSGSKGDTYKKLRTYIGKFKEKNGSCICRELKGVETGKVLCSCPQCITDAVALTEEYLAENR